MFNSDEKSRYETRFVPFDTKKKNVGVVFLLVKINLDPFFIFELLKF